MPLMLRNRKSGENYEHKQTENRTAKHETEQRRVLPACICLWNTVHKSEHDYQPGTRIRRQTNRLHKGMSSLLDQEDPVKRVRRATINLTWRSDKSRCR